VLGPLRIRAGGGVVAPPGGPGPRALLGILLLDPGEDVAAAGLVDTFWGRERGSTAALHTTIFRLRAWLRDRLGTVASVERTAGGYRLILRDAVVDAVRFRSMTARAATLPDDARAQLLDGALRLWRGPVLGGAAYPLAGVPAVVALERARITAVRDLAELCLAIDRPDDALAHLRHAAAANPSDEPLHALLIRALAASGRTAEATLAYDRPRQRTPSPALLPPDVPDFTGRVEQRDDIERLAGGRPDGTARAGLPVVGIAGMAGVGKSALAVHVAHRLAESYPDGQLHANLRGAERSPLHPKDVLATFLRALGVDWRAVPADTEERTALFRSHLAGRRVLVVLDNAASEEQVRPLLPGSATCAVLVTSRRRLTGLSGSRWLDLPVLSGDEAVRLLGAAVDQERIARQPDEAAEIVRLCGALPLAVRVAGARLTARPAWGLDHLAALLGDQRRRLDQLSVGDLEVRASLALSYDGLDDDARRLFRFLGLFDVPDFTAILAAAVLETSTSEAAVHIDSLVDAQLLVASAPDGAGQPRHRFHDLVRLYARERADAEDSRVARERAIDLGMGGWLAVAERMATHVPGPCYAVIGGSARRPAIAWEDEEVLRAEPLAWFDAELATLLSAVRQCCELDLDEVAFDLAGCLEKYFDLRGMYSVWEALNVRVMAACRRNGNLRGEAVMLRGLVDVRTWITNDRDNEATGDAYENAGRLLALFTELDDARGRSDAEVTYSWALAAAGRHGDAIESATRGLRLAEDSGHLGGQARAHVALAVAHREQARLDVGLAHLARGLAAARELGNPRYEATVLQFLGIGHLESGDLDASERRLNESLAISRRYRDRYPEALTLLTLARLHLHRGDPRARAEADAALAIGREHNLGHHVAQALAVRGEIELADGRPAEAVRLLEESVAIWRTRGWLSFQADALTALGRAYTAVDPAAARAAFAEAAELYARLGQPAKGL
jgi:DNA-binding SARP family transcriptional activator/tetratricopeptide (TPR) repeat protein